jgi:DNA-binding CsgD family transcriptional regulator
MREVLEEGRQDRTSLVHGLASLVPGVFCVFNELDLPTRRQLSYHDNIGGPAEMARDDPYWRLRHQHPACRHMETGSLDVVQIIDFVPMRLFRRTQIWVEMFKPEGIDHLISVPLPTAPGRTRVYLFGREAGHPFTEDERDMLTLLQPHLYELHRQNRPRVNLTRRQLDVLRCVAMGMSNGEAARQLCVTEGTVAKHLENAYARLGVTSRTAAVTRVFPGAS